MAFFGSGTADDNTYNLFGCHVVGGNLLINNILKMINITFPDNSVKQFEAGVTPLQIAQSLSPQLARDVLAASINDQEWDLTRPIESDATIKLFKWDDAEGKHALA